MKSGKHLLPYLLFFVTAGVVDDMIDNILTLAQVYDSLLIENGERQRSSKTEGSSLVDKQKLVLR